MTALAAPPPPKAAAPNDLDVLLDSLGGIPAWRVVLDPQPGTVTPGYFEQIDGRMTRVDEAGNERETLVELVNGTLVEKAMGADESRIGGNFLADVNMFLRRLKLGFATMADGPVRMLGGNRREPDVTVFLREDYPGGKRPKDKVCKLPPRLTVEVLSEDNTPREIDMKLREYFARGCRLAYVIDPRKRDARRHTSPDDFTTIDADSTLDGGDVLPGFTVALADVFDDDEE